MLKEIKILSGGQFKNLKKPVLFLVADSIFHMMNYMMFYFTVTNLMTGTFTLKKIIIYTLI
ncbi:MAG: ABC transporter ATP-binding protein, partial [Leptotrichiaceae bacterium]|nr:ABC transporter ATP-binding protein [Leptotrichiaceae bacterium]